jgi:hypothetical protein
MEMTLSETLLRSYWDSNKTKHESIVNKLHYYPCGIRQEYTVYRRISIIGLREVIECTLQM